MPETKPVSDLAEKLNGWTSADTFFGPAYIDIDEIREQPIRHRYIHGGFATTDTRFSIYLPDAAVYEGRFIQFLQGAGGGDENIAARLGTGYLGVPSIEHAFECGAYLCESNQGHIGNDWTGIRNDATIQHWRASAQSARFAKQVAAEIYGSAPHHGYIYGGSGGGLNSIHCIERERDLYNGAVPFVMPHIEQGAFFSVQLNALRVLRRKLDRHTDAVAVGGQDDDFWENLTVQEREALTALYRLGYPRDLSIGPSYEAAYVTAANVTEIMQYDPGYFEDFWKKPGYMGHDRPESFAQDLVDGRTKVAKIVTARQVAEYDGPTGPQDSIARMGILGGATPDKPIGIIIEDDLTNGEPLKMTGTTITILSGEAKGRVLACLGETSAGVLLVTAGPGGDPRLFEGVQVGDQVEIHNRNGLAVVYWEHHHNEFPHYPERRSYSLDGKPISPQRPKSPLLKRGPEYMYAFDGHMIIVQNRHDRGTWPVGPRRYEEMSRATMGPDFDQKYRVYWNDHASHVPAQIQPKGGPAPVITTREVDYGGSVMQAVSDLINWVEKDIQPPGSSQGSWTEDNHLTLAPTADLRRGIQPVIQLRVNGGLRADVKVGETVKLEAIAEVPPGTGYLISAEWDFDGKGHYPVACTVSEQTRQLKDTQTFRYDQPGTYFPVLRATSHRSGDKGAQIRCIPNLGRARVVVS